MSNLFIPRNGKRPNPTTNRPSGGPRREGGTGEGPSPPPPFFAPPPPPLASSGPIASTSTSSWGSGGSYGPSSTSRPLPPPPPPLPALSTSGSRSIAGLSRLAPPPPSTSTTATSVPPPLHLLDVPLQSKLDSIFHQLVQLSRLNQQSIEQSATTSLQQFDDPTLSLEESQELTFMWNEGKKKLLDRERKERESIAKSCVDTFGQVLLGLVERVGTEVVDKKVEVLRKEVEGVKKTIGGGISNGSSNANSPSIVIPPNPLPPQHQRSNNTSRTSIDSQSSALEQRIEIIERQLSETTTRLNRSEQEREGLQRRLELTTNLFETRLKALENRTVDPRINGPNGRNGNGVTNGGRNSMSPPLTSTSTFGTTSSVGQESETVGKLKKDVEELQNLVLKDSTGTTTRLGKRSRVDDGDEGGSRMDEDGEGEMEENMVVSKRPKVDVEEVKNEMGQLKNRLQAIEDGLRQVSEQIGEVKGMGDTKTVTEDLEEQVRNVKTNLADLLDVVNPLRDSESPLHPTNLLLAVESLQTQVSPLKHITHLESALLATLYDFSRDGTHPDLPEAASKLKAKLTDLDGVRQWWTSLTDEDVQRISSNEDRLVLDKVQEKFKSVGTMLEYLEKRVMPELHRTSNEFTILQETGDIPTVEAKSDLNVPMNGANGGGGGGSNGFGNRALHREGSNGGNGSSMSMSDEERGEPIYGTTTTSNGNANGANGVNGFADDESD